MKCRRQAVLISDIDASRRPRGWRWWLVASPSQPRRDHPSSATFGSRETRGNPSRVASRKLRNHKKRSQDKEGEGLDFVSEVTGDTNGVRWAERGQINLKIYRMPETNITQLIF